MARPRCWAPWSRWGPEPRPQKPSYLQARLLEDQRRDGLVEDKYRALVRRFPAREVAGAALWRLGWLAYLRGDASAAASSWTQLTDVPGGRAYRLAALYWTGRAKDQLGSREAAQRAYQRVLGEAPRSYYGLLAEHRITAPKPVPRDSGEPALRLPANPRDAVAGDPGFERVDLLRRLGLVDLALVELA